ncbi:hypothetical protein [Gimesia aquarii]|uniref:Uncharacterized protein n=1 Tax=Gimesia aquarii TaxID=2527964 RepID=A0A517VRA4_9PLAN|nr:hypothetical protein [Gimesia aquarii]QDT95551.1 hypothetical protein V144x_09960 [Gimesia aquarii]
MPIPNVSSTVTFPRDPRLYLRDHGRFLREANRHAAVYHHRQHIPRHFESFAAVKYGYPERRSYVGRRRYQEIKNQLGLPPLVSPRLTGGRTRDHVTTQRRVTATQKRARLTMTLPFRGGTGRFRLQPGQRELSVNQKVVLQIISEIEAIAPDEQRTLNSEIHNDYARRANQPGVRTIKRFGGRS